jgi:hypothetical protein
LLDFAADEIGQAAVGERDVGTAFDEGDFGGFGKAAGAGGRAGPAATPPTIRMRMFFMI